MLYNPRCNETCFLCPFNPLGSGDNLHNNTQMSVFHAYHIYQNVNVQKQKIIFQACFVEISVIDTNSNLSIFLGTLDSIYLVISSLIFKVNRCLNF